jgi:hypothetical protein
MHNTPPWRFTADGGPQVSLHADVDRRLAVADPDGREMMISCGAALFTVRLTLRSLGYVPQTRVLPEPGQPTLVARVSWRPGADADEFERRLSGHVLTRRTHRDAFDPGPLPPDTGSARSPPRTWCPNCCRRPGRGCWAPGWPRRRPTTCSA